MARVIIPVIAVLLIALAVTGVAMGVRVQLDAEDDTGPTDAGSTSTSEGGGADVAEPASSAVSPRSFISFGVASAPDRHEGAIRLATYNVENLFDDIDDPELSGRYEDIDDTKPRAHLEALAAAIRELDADVLALQEIESESVIRSFRDTYLADLGYAHLASIDAGDERGIEQAVLSRYPITDVTNWPRRALGGVHPEKWGDAANWHAGEPIVFHRSPLRVRIEVPGELAGGEAYPLTLYVVHCKSGSPGEYWREAECRGLAELLLEGEAADPSERVVVLGDFNAFLSAPSVQHIVRAGFIDAQHDVYEPVPAYSTHQSARRIDLILINEDLAPDLVPGSGFVLGTPALPEGADWRDPWRPEGYASDHYAVAIEIIPGLSGR